MKLMATPVRRKYFETLRRMLGPAGLISIREEQFFLVLAIAIGILAGFCVVLFRVAIAVGEALAAGQFHASRRAAGGAGSGADGAGDRGAGGALLPAGPGQRSEPDQGRAVHLRRLHLSEDRGGKVRSERAGHRQRTIAGAGRSGAADRRGPGIGAGALAEALQGTAAAGGAGGRGGGHWRRPSTLRSRRCCS